MAGLEGAARYLYNYFRFNVRRAPEVLFPPMDENIYHILEQLLTSNPDKYYVTKNDQVIDNQFLLALADPKNNLTSMHVEVLVSMLSEEHETILARERSRLFSTELLTLIMAKPRSFKAAKDKTKIRWSYKLKYVVNYPNAKWLCDIDTIYVPMLCSGHWVGLVINLKAMSIEVLNPHNDLFATTTGDNDLFHIASVMPYILNQCAGSGISGRDLSKPFKVIKSHCSSTCNQDENCAPITLKLLEMHLHGYKRGQISPDTFLSVRKQYLLDAYEHYVVYPWFVRFGD